MSMPRQFKTVDYEKSLKQTVTIEECLPPDHLARFIVEIIALLDLSQIYAEYAPRGGDPYAPEILLGLLFYGYATGVFSSRKIEKASYESIPFRFIAGGLHPDHDTISSFRKRHLKALAALFVQVLQLCQKAGLVKLGHIALDGTKVKANASKHKAMSYGRMLKKEKELKREIRRLLKDAERCDAHEDRLYGKGNRGDELPKELRFRESRLKKIQDLVSVMGEFPPLLCRMIRPLSGCHQMIHPAVIRYYLIRIIDPVNAQGQGIGCQICLYHIM